MLRLGHDGARVHHRQQPTSSFCSLCSFCLILLIELRAGVGALQPLPPNTGTSLVVDVAGTTKTTDVYWAKQCKTIPSNAVFIVIEMGDVSM